MKNKKQYVKEIVNEYEKLAKEKGVKLNSKAYEKMREFAWERYCRDYPNKTSLNDLFKFSYDGYIEQLVPSSKSFLKKIKM